jgi:hypothetical protein
LALVGGVAAWDSPVMPNEVVSNPPSLLKGEVGNLSLLSQYNPHGLFIALEDTSYLIMAVALLLAVGRHGEPDR